MSILACDPRKEPETRIRVRVQVFTFEMISGNIGRREGERQGRETASECCIIHQVNDGHVQLAFPRHFGRLVGRTSALLSEWARLPKYLFIRSHQLVEDDS